MFLRLRSFPFAVALTAALIAGCSASQSQQPIPSSQARAHSNNAHSWMAAGAKADNLLYVANSGNATVTVYSFRPAKLVGTLSGFSLPRGVCVDRSQNVYVTDAGTSEIYVYAHGGTKPINTLSDTYGYPYACSVDPKTGNLAVTDLTNGVLIYENATGTPTLYSSAEFSDYYFVAYDNNDDLFIDGLNGTTAEFAELEKDGDQLGNISLNQSIAEPQGLQWDGKYLAVADSGVNPNAIYEFSISGSGGTLVNTTSLYNTTEVLGIWIPKFGNGSVNPQGTRVVAADFYNANVPYFNYPAGGNAIKTLTDSLSDPYGVTVSKGRK